MNNDRKKSFYKKMTSGVGLALLLSVFFHGFFLAYQVADIDLDKVVKDKRVKQVKLVLKELLKRELNKNKSKIKKQIVASEKKDRVDKPKDSRFLSDANRTVDRQTVTKKIGSFKKAGKGKRKGIHKKMPSKNPGHAKTKKKKESKLAKKRKITRKKKISLADLAIGDKVPKKKTKSHRNLAALGLNNGDLGTTGLSQNNDFVDDVPLGDMTALNTVEYKYYGFYHRIKQKLEQHWGNSLRKKATALYKSGRRMPAAENRITSLAITIDMGGNIVE
ncbi:MAG: hypothetical protein HOM21_12995, partial [Halobacteriovoraceae bacterium]|nr:hypothetical protein [Halobacteriovoraceae bacterium]